MAVKKLTPAEVAERMQRLKEAHVPERSVNVPLSKLGAPGLRLREYLTAGGYAASLRAKRGFLLSPYVPGLAASYARDIALTGASVRFLYLQTFATWDATETEGYPAAFVIEFFEQSADSPFDGRARYAIETKISKYIDDGTIFYLFSGINPENSKWWSRQFMELLRQHCPYIGVDSDGNRKRGERTPVVRAETSRQENVVRHPRVRVR